MENRVRVSITVPGLPDSEPISAQDATFEGGGISMALVHQCLLLESGYGLDAIGAKNGVDLPRGTGETDVSYRERLAVKLRTWAESLIPRVATGKYLDEWSSQLTQPDDTKPRANHVRDAVEANR